MKRVFAIYLVLALVLSFTAVAYADNTAAIGSSVSFLTGNDIVISSHMQKEYVSDVLGLSVVDNSVVSLTDLASATTANSKAIKCVTELPSGEIEVSIAVPLIKDTNGRFVNAFSINPNYITDSINATTRSRDRTYNIPDIVYRVIAYYSQEVISNHTVYRLLSAKFKWWRADGSSTSYKVNRFKLNASVCGDLYDTSFNLIQRDYEKMKTVDKSNPTINTYYETGSIMSATGNVVTVSGGYQSATLDWEYWVTNRDGSNVRDIGSCTVFAP